MSKKKKEPTLGDIMLDIKRMESEKRERAMRSAGVTASSTDDMLTFDAWWMLRVSKIPKIHMKEIIWADFKGRGLSKAEKQADYDSALEKYGIKLK